MSSTFQETLQCEENLLSSKSVEAERENGVTSNTTKVCLHPSTCNIKYITKLYKYSTKPTSLINIQLLFSHILLVYNNRISIQNLLGVVMC